MDMRRWGLSICRHLSTALRSVTARQLLALCKHSSLSPSNTHTWRWKLIRNTVIWHLNQVQEKKKIMTSLALRRPPSASSKRIRHRRSGLIHVHQQSNSVTGRVSSAASRQLYRVRKVDSYIKENTYITVSAKLTRKIFGPKKELQNDPLKSTVKFKIYREDHEYTSHCRALMRLHFRCQ